MAEPLLPQEAKLRERIRDLEAEVERLRRGGGLSDDTIPRDAQLIESEERFRVAFATAPAGMVIVHPTGKILYVNKTFCRDAGRSEEEIIGKSFEEIGLYADEAMRQRIFELLTRQGYIEAEEFRYRSRDGSLHVGMLSSRPITIRGEVCQLGLSFNITAMKRAEAERARLEERLRDAQKMEAIGRLAGGVAHDFNNILTVITANVQVAMMDLQPDNPARSYLEGIGEAAWRAARLTQQMLAFSRKQVLEPQLVDLSGKVADLRSMLRRLIGENLELTVDLAPDLPAVLADPGQLEQVVMNLVVNARDAVKSTGSISISTRMARPDELARHTEHRGDFVVLEVTDDGEGIAPDVLTHIFEPFFTTKKEGRGTGLGLSTVEGIATQHRGFVEVDTAAGVGSTFRVFLPAAAGSATASSARATSGVTPRSGVVLLAEDDDSVRSPVARLLEHIGFQVVTARDGAEALDKLHTVHFDVLLTDVVMPGMSGRELANEARARSPHLAIVYLSGYTQDVIDQSGVLEPGVVLLRKPFDAEALAQAIDKAKALLTP